MGQAIRLARMPYYTDVVCRGGAISTLYFYQEPEGFYVEVERSGKVEARGGPWPSVDDPAIEELVATGINPLKRHRDSGARMMITRHRSNGRWTVLAGYSNRFEETGVSFDTRKEAEEAVDADR